MSKKIRIGIWGLGRAGINMHGPELEKYPELYEIKAGMDTDAEHCKIFGDKYNCKTYTEVDAFLNDPEIDMISVATRSTDHVAHALKALQTGKYVFLEKPIAMTYAEAKKLLEASKEYPGKLYIRHNRRFEAPFVHIREIIATGILGEVFEVKLRRNAYQRRMDWQTIISCGGGQLNNWGPHIIDHALRFLDCPVKELWSDLKNIACAGDAEDHLKVVLKGENGRVVDLEISGGAAISEPEYIIFGSKGALSCTGTEIKLKYINPEQKLPEITADPGNPPINGGFSNTEPIDWIEKTVEVAPEAGCDTHSIWKFMYKSIRNGEAFPISVEEAVEIVRITEQIKKGTPYER